MPIEKMSTIRKEVVGYYLDGESDASIADRFDVCKNTIQQDRKNNRPFWQSEALPHIHAELGQEIREVEHWRTQLTDRSYSNEDVISHLSSVLFFQKREKRINRAIKLFEQ